MSACERCNGTGFEDSGGVQPWGEQILVKCECRLMERNMDESRKAFESWLMEEFGYRQDYLEYWRGDGDYRSHPDLRSRWQGWNSAWNASRSVIELVLPDCDKYEATWQYQDAAEEVLRAAGLKIKE